MFLSREVNFESIRLKYKRFLQDTEDKNHTGINDTKTNVSVALSEPRAPKEELAAMKIFNNITYLPPAAPLTFLNKVAPYEA